jgi:hypothetical protein
MISSETLRGTIAWNLNGFQVLEFPRMEGNAMPWLLLISASKTFKKNSRVQE